MLSVKSVDVMTAVVPFRMNFRHALASRSRSESVVVRTIDGEGHAGFGEAVPRSYVTGETIETVRQTLRQVLVPPLLGISFSSFEEVSGTLKQYLGSLPRNQHAAFCALEISVLDLAGKVFGKSAGSVAGEVRSSMVRYSGVIPAIEPEAALGLCKRQRPSECAM